jgi:sugar phosphate isomerase/epimerase
MKLACSSTAFDELLRSGELTQLEWIDLCAHDLTADGAVFDVRHFPRTDTDYLAQVKKMAVDLGLTVAALRHDGFFTADAEHMEQQIEIALALGAPLLSAPLPLETGTSWSELQSALGTATSLAKRHNVTLAVRNEPHTFGASTHDLKRVAKEADSAWLRFGPDFAALDAGSDPEALLPKTVLAWQRLEASEEPALRLLGQYRGFVVLDAAEGNASAADMKNALRRWRSAFDVADRT